MIEGFFDEYRWLSNFWEVEIEYEDIKYPSVEHYYVALKINEPQTFNVNDIPTKFDVQEAREYISKLETPAKAKKLGKEEINKRKDWDDVKISIMEYGLKQKYSQEPFKGKLIHTYPMKIIETNWWNDTYWGVCDGVGKNVLGKLIMKIREEIRR